MKTMRKLVQYVGVVGALVVLVGCGTQVPEKPAAAPMPGHPAPYFSLSELATNKNVTLATLLDGHQFLLLNAFASWCGPCREEAPTMEQFASKYDGKVRIVGVNMTQGDNMKGLKQFVSQYHVSYPVLLDENGDFLSHYNIVGFPTTFLISPTGTVLKVHVGPITEQQLRAMLDNP